MAVDSGRGEFAVSSGAVTKTTQRLPLAGAALRSDAGWAPGISLLVALTLQVGSAGCFPNAHAENAAEAVPAGDAERGRRIYREGRDPGADREVMARIGGDDGVDVPAWTLPCATCHGGDGVGGLPGQEVTPPDIRWPTLMTAIETESGRKRPAYRDRAAVGRAVIEGLDAADYQLSKVMPRYALTPEQWAAVAAYLESLAPQSAKPR